MTTLTVDCSIQKVVSISPFLFFFPPFLVFCFVFLIIKVVLPASL